MVVEAGEEKENVESNRLYGTVRSREWKRCLFKYRISIFLLIHFNLGFGYIYVYKCECVYSKKPRHIKYTLLFLIFLSFSTLVLHFLSTSAFCFTSKIVFRSFLLLRIFFFNFVQIFLLLYYFSIVLTLKACVFLKLSFWRCVNFIIITENCNFWISSKNSL